VLTQTKSVTRAGDAVGVLDIGTSKTVCLIVAAQNTRTAGVWRREAASVLGFGHRPSRGLKAGVVIELDGAEQAVRAAVTKAEERAGLTIEQVLVAVTGEQLRSTTFEAETRIERDVVRVADTDRLMAAGRKYARRGGQALLHLNHIAYRLDGTSVMPDPFGRPGSLLAADLHAVTVEEAALRNLLQVVERAYLSPAGTVPAPYASGLAATTEEERRLGATCIDLGAGATTVSMFAAGRLLWVGTVAVGGQHVTFDIARALSTPFVEAERIKTTFGTLETAGADDREDAADDDSAERGSPLPAEAAANLSGIIADRISDLLNQVAACIEESGVSHLAAHRIILTGGGSQLPGLPQFAEQVLQRPVRIGRPRPISGLPTPYCAPQFSTAFGLVQTALDPVAGAIRNSGRGDGDGAGYLRRVGQWLREGF
jgi:cell division protein FtsA